MKHIFFIVLISLATISCKDEKKSTSKTTENHEKTSSDSLIYPEEKHFKSLKQITFGGDNAEAYWSFDDEQLVFQSNNTNWNVSCDQMFLMNVDDTFKDKIPPMLSTGKGRTTCAYFLQTIHILFTRPHI